MTPRRSWTSGLALLLIGCQPPLLDEEACQQDQQCPGGFVCAQGHCTRAVGDAGHVDGVALDGQGLDAAPRDLAQPDSSESPTDSAGADSAPPADAVADDQHTQDVATADAPPQDAGAPDAAAVDDVQVVTDGPAPVDAEALDQVYIDALDLDVALPDSAPLDVITAVPDAAEPADAAGPDTSTAIPDAALSTDTTALDDATAADDAWIEADSATPQDASQADHSSLDRVLVRDGWVVLPDGPVVELDASIETPVVMNASFEASASAPLFWTSYGNPCTPSVYTFGPDSDVQAVDGNRVYGCSTGDPSYSAGLLQQVSGLIEGLDYVLGVNAYLWAGCPTTVILGRLGVDPDGRLDPDGAVWTAWIGEVEQWQALSLNLVGKSTAATVFIEYSMNTMGYTCSEAQDLALFDLVTLTPK